MAEFWRGYLFGLGTMSGVMIVLFVVLVDRYMRPFR